MKSFLFQAILILFGLLIVMAVVFRAEWARDTLRFGRNLAWAYVIAIVLLAAVRIWQGGF